MADPAGACQQEMRDLGRARTQAAGLLIASGNHPEEEIDKVTTPMGCTIQGLNEMEHHGLSSSLIQGIVASFDKISEFKKDNQ